jgi:hypothetical protein
MAWVRRRGKRYFYLSVRREGRVAKWYYGRGRDAERVAEPMEAAKRWRLVDRQGAEAARAETARREELVGGWLRLVAFCAHAELTEAGYHRHDRGHWRKKRMGTTTARTTCESPSLLADSVQVGEETASVLAVRSDDRPTCELSNAVPPADESVEGFVARVQREGKAGLEPLRNALQADPTLAERLCGRIGERAEDILLGQLTKDDAPAGVVLKAQLRSLRESLVGEGNGGSLDRLVCEAVATSWLAWQVSEMQAAAILTTTAEGGRYAKAIRERLTQDFARFLKATRELATVRRLLRPSPNAMDLLNLANGGSLKKVRP